MAQPTKARGRRCARLRRRERIGLGLALLSIARRPGEVLTLEDIAAWCDCPPSTIQRIERGALEKARWHPQNPAVRRALLAAMSNADSQLIDYAAASPSRKTFFYEVANALPSQFRRAAGRIPARCRNREACGPFFSIDCHSGFFGVWLLVWFPVAVLSAFKGISGRFA